MALIAIQRKTAHNNRIPGPAGASGAPAGATDQLAISEKAATHILELGHRETGSNALLRIAIEGGGCGGFRTRFRWESTSNPNDTVFTRGDARVCIDAKSLRVLQGSTLHWREELGRSGFHIATGQKSSSCSCGQSFSLL
ncbi:MAG: iron-sulfur cluster assembly accessory protein [Myxococcota bacterium]